IQTPSDKRKTAFFEHASSPVGQTPWRLRRVRAREARSLTASAAHAVHLTLRASVQHPAVDVTDARNVLTLDRPFPAQPLPRSLERRLHVGMQARIIIRGAEGLEGPGST